VYVDRVKVGFNTLGIFDQCELRRYEEGTRFLMSFSLNMRYLSHIQLSFYVLKKCTLHLSISKLEQHEIDTYKVVKCKTSISNVFKLVG
jgi:hypothetical protein